MKELQFGLMVAGAAFLVASCASRPHPWQVDIRPASGERVALVVKGGDGLQFNAQAEGLAMKDRLLQFTAPGTLVITGGEGELELSAADTAQRFVLIVKRDKAGVTSQLETLGQRAIIGMRDGKMKIEGESMTMRKVRGP